MSQPVIVAGPYRRRARIRPIVAWYDCWVGLYFDREKRRLYILPIPCVGLVIEMVTAPASPNRIRWTRILIALGVGWLLWLCWTLPNTASSEDRAGGTPWAAIPAAAPRLTIEQHRAHPWQAFAARHMADWLAAREDYRAQMLADWKGASPWTSPNERLMQRIARSAEPLPEIKE